MMTNSVVNQPGTIVPTKPVKPTRAATLHLVQSSRFAKRLAKLLLFGLVASIFAMAFLPWQQTSRGNGFVSAFDPQERMQPIEARVKGVVVEVADGLYEGSRVKQDQFILQIQPIASNQVEQLQAQKSALQTMRDTRQMQADVYNGNVNVLTESLEFTVSAANQWVESTRAKLKSEQELIFKYEANVTQAKLAYDRAKSLNEQGLKPLKEVEKTKQVWDGTVAELAGLHEKIASLELEVSAKVNEREEKQRVGQAKIDSARAMYNDALSKVASAEKDIANIEIKLTEMGGLRITAPRDGTIFRMPVYEEGMMIKEGDPILTIIPDTTQEAVELFINGNDMPLVQVGQDVRLQFEGWPAVQFAGWPSVAVGTFGGTVASIDATDNGKGQFRVLVTPGDDEWPSERYLRQGVRVNGWVMLRRVSLGYEIWRQLNGFPVIVSTEEPEGNKEIKTPKLPKE